MVIPEAGSKQSIAEGFAEGRRSGKNYKMDNEERRMVMLIGAFILILGLWILINTIVISMFLRSFS